MLPFLCAKLHFSLFFCGNNIGNLVIKDVEKTDAGDYICVAENMAGVKQSDVATLSVHGKLRKMSFIIVENMAGVKQSDVATLPVHGKLRKMLSGRMWQHCPFMVSCGKFPSM
jgi:hypothetical protein